MPVGGTQELDVELIAVGQNRKAIKIPRGNMVGSRSLQVGGVEEAKLSVPGGKVDVSSVGPTRGLIGQPGDEVNWSWGVTPKETGTYMLDLVITTYQGSSDNPLFVINPPIRIKLVVTNTFLHRLDSAKVFYS